MSTNNFKAGDVVRLKSGGPAMTIHNVYNEGMYIDAYYFLSGKLQEINLPAIAVEGTSARKVRISNFDDFIKKYGNGSIQENEGGHPSALEIFEELINAVEREGAAEAHLIPYKEEGDCIFYRDKVEDDTVYYSYASTVS